MFFIIFFLLIPVLNLLKKWKFFRRLAEGVENYISNKAERELQKREGSKLSITKIKTFAVFIFVAIPLPMTGIWMGSALAVFLGLKFKEAVLPVAIGNLIAGLIISVLAEVFLEYVDIILGVLLALAVILLIVFIIKVYKVSKKGKVEDMVAVNDTVPPENHPNNQN